MTDMSENAAENPAAQATGKSLAELFAADPMDLTESDRRQIIKTFRQERAKFLEQEQQKKTKETKGSAAKKASQDLNIDVDDIDI